MICKNCGTNCADGMKFCVICGTPFDVAPTPVAEPVEAPAIEPVSVPEPETVTLNSSIDLAQPADTFSFESKPEEASSISSYYDEKPATPETNNFDNYSNITPENNSFGAYSNPTPVVPTPSYKTNRVEPNYVSATEMTENMLPEHLKPISPWGYLGYTLLFSAVPCAGIIFAFIFAFSSDGNVNRRNYARYYLITLLISIVLTILLYAFIFAMVGTGAFPGGAFGDIYY